MENANVILSIQIFQSDTSFIFNFSLITDQPRVELLPVLPEGMLLTMVSL